MSSNPPRPCRRYVAVVKFNLRRLTADADFVVLIYSELESSVTRRLFDDVQSILDKSKYGLDVGKSMELAVGWSKGLEFLVNRGYEARPAIYVAINSKDAKSLAILLTSQSPVFSPGPEYNQLWAFTEAYRSKDAEIWALVVNEFKDRRKRLNDLAIKEFTLEEQTEIGLPKDKVLDEKAGQVFEMLLEKGVTVPEALDCCRMSSAYSFILMRVPVKFLDSIYNAGFESIDCIDDNGKRTPLLHCLEDGPDNPTLLPAIKWFLSKGASPEFTLEPDMWPNVMFYLAAIMDEYYCREDDFEEAMELCLLHYDLLLTDNCVCFCSSVGCLPSHLLWRCASKASPLHESCHRRTT